MYNLVYFQLEQLIKTILFILYKLQIHGPLQLICQIIIIPMNPDGTQGSVVDFTLNLENDDADLDSSPKYYASKTIIIEVVSSYVNNPLVTDSLTFEVVIQPIADLEVIIAGTGTEIAASGNGLNFLKELEILEIPYHFSIKLCYTI